MRIGKAGGRRSFEQSPIRRERLRQNLEQAERLLNKPPEKGGGKRPIRCLCKREIKLTVRACYYTQCK